MSIHNELNGEAKWPRRDLFLEEVPTWPFVAKVLQNRLHVSQTWQIMW